MEYEAFYHLRREPFNLSPDPAFLYLAPSHAQAMAELLAMVRGRRGFAVLTGEVGTGKTTLLRALLDSCQGKIRTAYVVNPPRSREELYRQLASEFGLNLKAPDTWMLTLQRFLLKAFTRGSTILAIFDEAQSLPVEVLEEIRLLTNLETSSFKLLQVVLAGQPEFDAILDSNPMRALRQRVALRLNLTPLGSQDTVQYIAKRMDVAGADVLPFNARACTAVHRYSRGIPRLVNLLCDLSLLAGHATSRRVIDEGIVELVARKARLAPPAPARPAVDDGVAPLPAPNPLRMVAAFCAVVVLIASLAAAAYRVYPEQMRAFFEQIGTTTHSITSDSHTGAQIETAGKLTSGEPRPGL